MPEYFVLVSKLDGPSAIEKDLCGKLWSINSKDAHKEAKSYQATLNGGWPLEVLKGQYHTATSSTLGTTRSMKGFSRFKSRRVTDKNKWDKNTVKQLAAKKRTKS